MTFKKESFDYLIRDYRFKPKETMKGPGIRYLTFYEKDKTLLVSNISNDGKVHLINFSDGTFRTLKVHNASVRKIRVFNDDIITGSWDGSVCISDYNTLQPKMRFTERTMGRCPYFNVSMDGKYLYSFSYDSDVVVQGVANRVRKWCLKSGKLLKRVDASTEVKGSPRSGSIIVHENRYFVCSDSGYFRVFDSKTDQLLKDIVMDVNFRTMTAFFRHGLLLASDWNGFLHFFDLKSNTMNYRLKLASREMLSIRIHPMFPDVIITACANGIIKFWQYPEFELLSMVYVGGADPWSMVFVNNNLLVTGNHFGEIMIYDIHDVLDVRLKGKILLSDTSFLVQPEGSKQFYTNDLSVLDVIREPEQTIVTGKQAEYLLGQGNSLMALRELFGIEDNLSGLLNDNSGFIPLIPETSGYQAM